jgi:hypothetical protein
MCSKNFAWARIIASSQAARSSAFPSASTIAAACRSVKVVAMQPMATKRDILGITEELADIKQRLKAVEAAVEDHAGHSKEIDHALERIAAIEEHLGLAKKIAA